MFLSVLPFRCNLYHQQIVMASAPPGADGTLSPSLVTLPKDLLLSLLDFISRPMDHKALCHVCKALREVAIPRLYHAVQLDRQTYGYPWEEERGFFRANHPGHQYVRDLEMGRGCDPEKCGPEQRFIKLALLRLPRNCLKFL